MCWLKKKIVCIASVFVHGSGAIPLGISIVRCFGLHVKTGEVSSKVGSSSIPEERE